MVWGFILALILVAGICFLASAAINKRFSVVSYILAVILWVVLSFETNSLIKAIEGRTQTADLVSTICGSVSDYIATAESSSIISFQEANELALGCKVVLPLQGKYFHASDFQGRTYGEIPAIISANIDKAARSSVWNKVGWIILTLILGVVLVAVFMENNFGNRQRTYSRKENNKRDSRNYQYHSRRRY